VSNPSLLGGDLFRSTSTSAAVSANLAIPSSSLLGTPEWSTSALSASAEPFRDGYEEEEGEENEEDEEEEKEEEQEEEKEEKEEEEEEEDDDDDDETPSKSVRSKVNGLFKNAARLAGKKTTPSTIKTRKEGGSTIKKTRTSAKGKRKQKEVSNRVILGSKGRRDT
jgi:hypothetical protein